LQQDDPTARRFKAAVYAHDVDGLRALFAEHPELVEALDEPWFHFDKPALVQAAADRNRALVDALLDLGADIEARSTWAAGPYSALHALVDGADEESLALAAHLVDRGATLDLHAAAGMGRVDVIERILAEEPERVSEPGPDGATPLHLARDVETAETLLRHGAEIDRRCVDHRSTAAMWATQGREPVVRYLLDRGATADLFMAALLDDVALAERLLAEDPEAIDVRVVYGTSHPHVGFGDKYIWALGGAETPVELARRRGSQAVYALLLERSPLGAKLVQAARRADTAEIDRLFEETDDLLARVEEREICEALYGSPEAARRLLSRGADPGARDDHVGGTALHHAAWRGDVPLATVLLEGGADAALRDRTYDATPLGWARQAGRSEAAALLESVDPDVRPRARPEAGSSTKKRPQNG